jgi:hypothetical protein
MITGITKKHGISNKVVWFSRDIKFWDCVSNVTYYSCFDLDRRGFIPFVRRKKYTLINDLTLSDEELLAHTKTNTRNEIRRALKEGCEYTAEITISEFVVFYNLFASEKRLPNVNDGQILEWGPHIALSAVKKDGRILAMHAHLVDEKEKIANLLFSASIRLDAGFNTKIVGWGNRFLHYRDMLELKKRGVLFYDWGGLYIGFKDRARIGIAEFKKSFGGELKTVDSYYSVLSVVFFLIDKILLRLKMK